MKILQAVAVLAACIALTVKCKRRQSKDYKTESKMDFYIRQTCNILRSEIDSTLKPLKYSNTLKMAAIEASKIQHPKMVQEFLHENFPNVGLLYFSFNKEKSFLYDVFRNFYINKTFIRELKQILEPNTNYLGCASLEYLEKISALCIFEKEYKAINYVVDLCNELRKSKNLEPLVVNKTLEMVAKKTLQNGIQNDEFFATEYFPNAGFIDFSIPRRNKLFLDIKNKFNDIQTKKEYNEVLYQIRETDAKYLGCALAYENRKKLRVLCVFDEEYSQFKVDLINPNKNYKKLYPHREFE